MVKFYFNSYLYIFVFLVLDFLGCCFWVEVVLGFGKKELKVFLMDMDKVNIMICNFLLLVVEFCKCLKLKEGGDDYIFVIILFGG